MRTRSHARLPAAVAIIAAGLTIAGEASANRDVVIANRGSASLTIIDGNTDDVVQTVDMPDDGEPMYTAFSPQFQRMWVVDRANSQAVVFDILDGFSVEGTVPTGEGAFHCWIDPFERQLWITNDIDQSVTVIDTVDLEVITTIDLPDEYVDAGYVAHDVNLALGWWDRGAFVTMLAADQPGVVLRYSSLFGGLTASRELGGDPHVTMSIFQPNTLYVMAQDSDSLHAVRRHTLADLETPLEIDGVHGAVMNRFYLSRYLYTTDIENGRIITVDRNDFEIVDELDSEYPVPHNLATSTSGDKLYVTHSGGAADVVTIYDLDRWTGVPTYRDEVTVGLNPFGLATFPVYD